MGAPGALPPPALCPVNQKLGGRKLRLLTRDSRQLKAQLAWRLLPHGCEFCFEAVPGMAVPARKVPKLSEELSCMKTP